MHRITYRNAFSEWDEALPLGNGHFGAMGYFSRDEGLAFTLNHYDVYYRRLQQYARDENSEALKYDSRRPYTQDTIRERALEARRDPEHVAHSSYNFVLHPEFSETYGWVREGYSQVVAGELRVVPSVGLRDPDSSSTSLCVEQARFEFSAQSECDDGIKRGLSANAIIACDRDILVLKLCQSSLESIESLEIGIPLCRGLQIDTCAGMASESVFYARCSFHPDGDAPGNLPFSFVYAVKLVGARGEIIGEVQRNGLSIKLIDASREVVVLATVAAPDDGSDPLEVAIQALKAAQSDLPEMEQAHVDHWQRFWHKSRIDIPDKMLENLWYVNLYSLACCSGEGAKLYQQACGLNGLWGIKSPTQWGSMWYWDVNIEQSFWPIYTSNHLEIGDAFYKALLSFVDDARRLARDLHGIDGISADFPFDFYMCLWPWCAQNFWWHYKYSGDESFLREKAYPLFKGVLEFFESYLETDADGTLSIFPEVSPEQGPMTRNSTITLACLKYLLVAAVEACSVLGGLDDDRDRWNAMLNRLPDYSLGDNARFGTVIKDSEWADPDQYLAHSSLLMPIYPEGELTPHTRPEMTDVLLNTLRYADASQAIGTHNMWLAPVAARLGLGDEAARLLYDRGIAYLMRANGLFAEETERWIQNCLVSCAPVYNPPLMEAGGVVAATVSEMLLQSRDGVVRVFPAVPTGRSAGAIKGKYDVPTQGRTFPAWDDCSFEGLLAEGAFEVSAVRRKGAVCNVRVKSLSGGILRLADPFCSGELRVSASSGDEIGYQLVDGVICFGTVADETYEVAPRGGASVEGNAPADAPGGLPLVWQAQTRRRVFLGKDENTEFVRAIDGATLDYYAGDCAVSPVTVRKFDFTCDETPKDYAEVLPRQYHSCGKLGLDFIGVSDKTVFSPELGYGWESVDGLECGVRDRPDCLRRDWVGSLNPATLVVELARGSYKVLIVSGDAEESTFTSVSLADGTSWRSGIIKPGRFAARTIALTMERDGVARMNFSSDGRHAWRLCAMIINRV